MGDQVIGGAWAPLFGGLLEQILTLLQDSVAAVQPHQHHHLLLLARFQVVDDRLELAVVLVILVTGWPCRVVLPAPPKTAPINLSILCVCTYRIPQPRMNARSHSP
ncbi:hypothetical protein D3C80_1781920 [compost metagenome]